MQFTRVLPAAALMVLALAPVVRSDDGDDGDCNCDDEGAIHQFLDSTGADPDATCHVFLKTKGPHDAGDADDDDDGDDDCGDEGDDDHEGKTTFEIKMHHLDGGTYHLLVNGVQVHDGEIEVGSKNKHGKLVYETPKKKDHPLFDFDVLGELLEIVKDDVVYFRDVFAEDDGGSHDMRLEVMLVNVGPDRDARGRLTYVSHDDEKTFTVQLSNLDEGDYDLVVDGVLVAQFEVTDVETKVQYKDPPEMGAAALDFNPLGKRVAIKAGGTTYLGAILPAGNDEAGCKGPRHGEKASRDLGKGHGDELESMLLNMGELKGAKGRIVLRQDEEHGLQLVIKSVPKGTYTVQVDGEAVGTVTVKGGKGKLDFGDGALPLDFTVKAKVVTLLKGGSPVLSALFPRSAQAALDRFRKEIRKPAHVKVNLVASGADLDASGVAVWKHTPAHDTLTLSVADLPVGAYDVLVGDVTIDDALVITKPDGRAKVRFDTKPAGKSLLLDVVVQGATVRVTPAEDNATVLLEAVVE